MFVTTEIFEETLPSDVILSFVLDGHWPVLHRLDSLGERITDIEKVRIFLVYCSWLEITYVTNLPTFPGYDRLFFRGFIREEQIPERQNLRGYRI